MKFFVTGVGGQLGHDVMNELHKRGYEGVGSDIQPVYSGVQDGSAVTAMPYVPMDITNKEMVERVLGEVCPDVVVHCAAWTAVDLAEDEDNQSMSVKGVLRGLHYQINYPQGKLVRVVKGRVFDVAVDLRPGSATYGQWHGVELSEENKKQYYISPGFAHGFLVLSDTAEFCYKCTDFYHANDEGGLAWNDPAIGIQWPELTGTYQGHAGAEGYALLDGTPLSLSEKDQKWQGLGEK